MMFCWTVDRTRRNTALTGQPAAVQGIYDRKKSLIGQPDTTAKTVKLGQDSLKYTKKG
jgi:hypothetical protein